MEEELQKLRIFSEQLEERIKKLEKPENIIVQKKEIIEKQYEDIKFYPQLKVDTLYYKTLDPAIASITFTEYFESQTTVSTNDWEDWDISAKVPVGTVAVLVYMRNADTSLRNMGIRKNGSSTSRIFTMLASGGNMTTIVEVGSDRIIERVYPVGTVSNSDFRIIGYWS